MNVRAGAVVAVGRRNLPDGTVLVSGMQWRRMRG